MRVSTRWPSRNIAWSGDTRRSRCGTPSASAPALISTGATTYRDSIAAGQVVEAPVSTQIADGMAVRRADPQALSILRQHLDRIVAVSDAEIAQAMRLLYTATHNVAEGAGAAALAAATQEKAQIAGQAIGLALTGGNVDATVFAPVLQAHK